MNVHLPMYERITELVSLLNDYDFEPTIRRISTATDTSLPQTREDLAQLHRLGIRLYPEEIADRLNRDDSQYDDEVLGLDMELPVSGPLLFLNRSEADLFRTRNLRSLLIKDSPYSVPDAVTLYGIVGGCPAYLNAWDKNKSIRDNVCDLILNPKGALFSEAEDFIGLELRELSVYDTILYAMAMGNEKLNDLYQTTGYSRAKISVYLKNLAAFDVIEKVISFETGGWDNTKKGIYRIKNPFLHFWFRFVYANQSALYALSPQAFYDTYIKEELHEYLSSYFVKVCREYVELLNMIGKTPIRITSMGTWIGKEGTIDVIGRSMEDEYVVGICNWKKEKLTFEDYQNLLYNMKQAKLHAKVTYLFSATTFEQRLMELEKEESTVVLVDMKEL